MSITSVTFAERHTKFGEPFKPQEPSSPSASTSIVQTRSRQTTFNSGVRGGLFEKKHSDAMGESVFLFGWLVTRQTKSNGLVFGGHAFTYSEISEESGWPVRTLERWMARRRTGGYVRVKHTAYCRMIIRVLNPKKFSPPSTPPEVADSKASPTPPPMADSTARSGGLKHGSVIGSNKSTPPTPPAAAGGNTVPRPPVRTSTPNRFVFDCREGQVIEVFVPIGKKLWRNDKEYEKFKTFSGADNIRGPCADALTQYFQLKGYLVAESPPQSAEASQ